MKFVSPWKYSIIIIVSFLITGHLSLRAQTDSVDYCPFAIEDATWVIYDNVGFYSPVGFRDSYVIKIKGDSLHNDILYKKMWVANWMHDNNLRPSEVRPPYLIDSLRFYGLVRDDVVNRRFLGIVPLFENENNDQEVLIHDFGIDIGEDMLGVYKFDTVALQNIVVDTFYGKVRLAHVPPRREVFTVEGIGTTHTGPLCQNPALALNEGYRALINYCIGSLEECGIQYSTTSTSNTPDRDRGDFSFYPNPVHTSTNLDVIVNGVPSGIITCFNSGGELVFAKSLTLGSNRLTFNHMPAGVYFLHFNGSVKKVIVL